MAYYRVCPECGCNLDPGEACDCRTETKREAAPLPRERPQARVSPHLVYQEMCAASRMKGELLWRKS